MKTRIHYLLITLVLLSTLTAFAQGTAFTYQGRFSDNGSSYTGNAEFQATLWSVPTGGTAVASNSPVSLAVEVTNGLFVLPVDFGGNFPGADRWLQLEVRTTLGPFTTLTPRQQLTPAPYAITAGNLTGTLPAAQLGGTVADAQLSPNVSLLGASIESAEIADGTIVAADVNAASFNNTFWRANGNTGANSTNGAFLGNTDNLPLEFKVNGQRALRIEPATHFLNGYSPNFVGGHQANIISNGFAGAVIGGGGSSNFPNRVGDHFATVVGGNGNTASGSSSTAMGSITTASGDGSTAMGFVTTASGGVATAMGAETTASGFRSTAMGNLTTASGDFSTAMGNLTTASGDFSTAMGFRAKANHGGSLVWADSQNADFASTADNQFSIRAANGVRIANSGDGVTLLRLDTERPWAFRQFSSGAGTALELGTVDFINPKNFLISANAVGINTPAPTHLLHVNGVARSTQSTWATSSDRRAKHKITPLESSLGRVARLRPVTFEYKSEYAAGRGGYEGRFTGFIAQEVEPVFPELVETVREQIGESAVDDFRLLNAGGLTPHLVAAVQELAREVESGSRKAEARNRMLEERLEQKETENAELKQSLTELKELVQTMNQKLNGGTQ